MKSEWDGAMAQEIAWNFLEREAAVLVLQVDAGGVILSANSYAREVTGLPLVGGSLRDLLIVSTEPADIGCWLTPSLEPRLINLRSADGLSQTLYLTSVPLGSDLLLLGQADPQEQEWLRRELLEVNHDLTALGRELSLANAELVRLNEVKNKFLGMASHDLRKPVGLILNQAELLLEDATLSPGAEALGILRSIIAAADSMARLIDGFLDVAMIESGHLNLELQAAAQEDLVAGALALVRPLAARRAQTVEVSLDQAIPRLRVDGPKLEQVLTNLLSNALEHSPDGARVTVASRLEARGIRFWVADQGAGLDQQAQRRLFQGGTGEGPRKPGGERSVGLGLVIVRDIVEAHGGSCFVESRPGAGSSIGFLLPASCLAHPL